MYTLYKSMNLEELSASDYIYIDHQIAHKIAF